MVQDPSEDSDGIPCDDLSTELVYKAYARVKLSLAERAKTFPMNTRAVCNLHRLLFQDVKRDLAGKLRSPDFPVNVTFGGKHRGTPYEDVPRAMEDLDENLKPMASRLDTQAGRNSLVRSDAVRVGGWYHANIVRIHPFRDGNGRVSRLCLNYFAYRYDLNEFRVLGDKDTRYIEVLDWYIPRRDVEPVITYLEHCMLSG